MMYPGKKYISAIREDMKRPSMSQQVRDDPMSIFEAEPNPQGAYYGLIADEARQRAENLRAGRVNRILGKTQMNPSDAIRRTVEQLSEQSGPMTNLQMAEKIAAGGQIKDPKLLAMSAAEAINSAIAKRPGIATEVGVPAAALGGVALITASGQALNDLGNFLAGGQQSQDTRDMFSGHEICRVGAGIRFR